MRVDIAIAAMPAVCLPVGDSDKATLMEDWTLKIRTWWLNVPPGTQTDGASIPRALWRLCGHPLQSPRVYAALVHDWIYGNGYGVPPDIDRAEADRIYRDLLIALGWGRVRSWVEYCALRLFGASHWTARTTQKN